MGPVWLVGMMGAGKSVLGHALAQRLGCRFVDADTEIERAAGASIAEIFEREGEAGFRARERALIEKLSGGEGVVALGGGAIAQPGMSQLLAARGTVVWLRASAETLLARVGDAHTRPLLNNLDAGARLARVRALLAEREPHYATASIVIDTEAAPLADLAELLARRLAEHEGASAPAASPAP